MLISITFLILVPEKNWMKVNIETFAVVFVLGSQRMLLALGVLFRTYKKNSA